MKPFHKLRVFAVLYEELRLREVISVKVEGGPFVRAHIQARSVAHPTVQVGSFVAPPPEYFKLVNCSGVYGKSFNAIYH